MRYAIHLDAGHDANGNPRRAFMVYNEEGELVGSADQGYLGDSDAVRGALPLDEQGFKVVILARVTTTAAFYRKVIRS